MCRLGIGSAKIDLLLNKEQYVPGESIKGRFLINGGLFEQKMKRIECDLVCIDHDLESETTVETSTILTSKLIRSQESNTITFSFQLPESIYPSNKERSYKFKTKLIFEDGIKSVDLDEIIIKAA
nr:sporulation protein [Mesobacillus harenae]